MAAARLFRERGLEGVGVDALADAAGLTHGAVYSHFKSKDELAAGAVRLALHQSMGEWLALTEGLAGDQAFERLLKAYVSRTHRDAPEAGCSVAAIGGAAPRGTDELREVMHDGVSQFLDVLTSFSEGATPAERRSKAMARAAAMVGAVVMARAASSDPHSVGRDSEDRADGASVAKLSQVRRSRGFTVKPRCHRPRI